MHMRAPLVVARRPIQHCQVPPVHQPDRERPSRPPERTALQHPLRPTRTLRAVDAITLRCPTHGTATRVHGLTLSAWP